MLIDNITDLWDVYRKLSDWPSFSDYLIWLEEQGYEVYDDGE